MQAPPYCQSPPQFLHWKNNEVSPVLNVPHVNTLMRQLVGRWLTITSCTLFARTVIPALYRKINKEHIDTEKASLVPLLTATQFKYGRH